MNMGTNKISLLLVFAVVAVATNAAEKPLRVAANAATAQRGCIELTTVAQTEETYVDENGQRAMRRIPAAKVVPGTAVIWTVSANNVCSAAAEKVFIDNPVPEHMQYVADSAMTAGAEVSFSLDGKRFAQPDALQVRDTAGQPRAARADEYTHIRWTFRNAIGPGQLATASFRATVR